MAANRSDPHLSSELIKRLHDAVFLRHIGDALHCLQAFEEVLLSLQPTDADSAQLIGYLSQLTASGCVDPLLIKRLLDRFLRSQRPDLPLSGYVHLKIAEGVVAAAEASVDAVGHFDFVISLQENVAIDDEALALAYLWQARCYRDQGKYAAGLESVAKAKDVAGTRKFHPFIAVIQIVEAQLYVLQEDLEKATAIVRDAERVLQATDDAAMLGNIYLTYGQIALREGDYDGAFTNLRRARDSFLSCPSSHRDTARALIMMAHCKRVLALSVAKRIDAEAAERRVGTRETHLTKSPTVSSRRRVEELRDEALSHLQRAEEMCHSISDNRIRGLAKLERGFVHLETGDLERAAMEAVAAYGFVQSNPVAKANARLLQSMIESAKYDEGIDERQDSTLSILRAQEYAKEALDCARQTDDRRLTARACVSYGLTVCIEPFADKEAARECYDEASRYFNTGYRDYLWEYYQVLKTAVLNQGNIDVRFQKWSRGVTDGKTFQEMVQEFADVVIPKVWEREDRKISRVAASLSISPKKVRRVLGRLGLKSS